MENYDDYDYRSLTSDEIIVFKNKIHDLLMEEDKYGLIKLSRECSELKGEDSYLFWKECPIEYSIFKLMRLFEYIPEDIVVVGIPKPTTEYNNAFMTTIVYNDMWWDSMYNDRCILFKTMEDWENFTKEDAHRYLCKIYITERRNTRKMRKIVEELNEMLIGKEIPEKISILNSLLTDYKDEVIVVSKEWVEQEDRREDDSEMLNALEAVGVDNWEGYGLAIDYLNGEYED